MGAHKLFYILSSYLPFMTSFHLRLLNLVLLAFCFFFVIFLIPSLVFDFLEDDWTTLDGFYFVFISLTTIGLGDYVPGGNSHFVDIYSFFVGIFLLIGLVITSLTFTLAHDLPQLDLGYQLGRERDLEEDEERVEWHDTTSDEEELLLKEN